LEGAADLEGTSSVEVYLEPMATESFEPTYLPLIDGCVSMNSHEPKVRESIHHEPQRVPHLELSLARDDARRVSD
jgi:hypothetical protein